MAFQLTFHPAVKTAIDLLETLLPRITNEKLPKVLQLAVLYGRQDCIYAASCGLSDTPDVAGFVFTKSVLDTLSLNPIYDYICEASGLWHLVQTQPRLEALPKSDVLFLVVGLIHMEDSRVSEVLAWHAITPYAVDAVGRIITSAKERFKLGQRTGLHEELESVTLGIDEGMFWLSKTSSDKSFVSYIKIPLARSSEGAVKIKGRRRLEEYKTGGGLMVGEDESVMPADGKRKRAYKKTASSKEGKKGKKHCKQAA